MRLALVLAAPFPLHQGSQVFVADQARALRKAGAAVTVVCYGTAGPGGSEVPVVRTPAAWTPRTLRSNASPAKLIADVALARVLLRRHRQQPFDAVLAHNSEAAAVALAVRRRLRIPVLYVVHTLLRYELSAYGPRVLGGGLRWAGYRLERGLARRADAVVVLSEEARAALAPVARGPVERIPPGLDPKPAPSHDERDAACRRHGLEPGGFVLYTGNVDGYQDLELLDAAAAELAPTPVVVATHDPAGARFAALRVRPVTGAQEMRALLHACAVAVLPRARAGGFPIKLLNYMEAERAIVARARVAEGLEHGRSAWLLPDVADGSDWAHALRDLLARPERAAALGRAARARLEAAHAWPGLAGRTLALAERTISGAREP